MLEKILFCKHSDQLFLSTANAEAIIHEYCISKKINGYRVSDTRFIFYRKRRIINFGQEITIDLNRDGDYWEIESREIFPSFFDFSANYYNVQEFLKFSTEYEESLELNRNTQTTQEENGFVSPLPPSTQLDTNNFDGIVVYEEEEFFHIPETENISDIDSVDVKYSEAVDVGHEASHTQYNFLVPNEFVVNRPPFYGNFLIIGVILLVYMLMIISSQTGDINSAVIRNWGALHDLLVASGQQYRLFTSIFIHINFVHAINNIIVLYLIGIYTEKWLDTKQYLITFASIGLASACISYFFHDTTYVLGASSAIFGILGLTCFAVIKGIFPKEIKWTIFIVIGVMILNLAFITSLWEETTDNVGHLAGFSFGFIFGIVYNWSLHRYTERDVFRKYYAVVVVLSIGFTLMSLKPKEYKEWSDLVEAADLFKLNADYVYDNYKTFPKDNVLKELDFAIDYYEEVIELSIKIEKVKVPKKYKEIKREEYKEARNRLDELILVRENFIDDKNNALENEDDEDYDEEDEFFYQDEEDDLEDKNELN